MIVGRSGSPWREMRNKLTVYRLVTAAGARLAAAADSLADGVRRAYEGGPFPALWAVEGLGLAWADLAWERREAPDFLLPRAGREALPDESLLMLHAGAGMAWSRRWLRGMAGAPPEEAARRLDELVAFVRAHARPGYAGAALEGLGLVARTFFPRQVAAVSARLAADDALAGFFWHGAGRSLYFLRRHFLPTRGSFRRAVGRVVREPPGEARRRDAAAGLAWAVTMVNLRHPGVVAERLRVLEAAAGAEAVANGVVSALVMRHDTTPDAPGLLAAFAGREPPAGPARAWWRERVAPLVAEARDRLHPALAARGRLDEVFRFQDPAALSAGPAADRG